MKTFLEVGSCYFDTLNYLSDFGWRGAIVEPIKKYLDRLEQKPNVYYINAGVDTINGTREIKMASDERVAADSDFAGMSSFISENPTLTERLLVNTITFQDIFNLTGITQLDYLKIDAEGYDGHLLLNYPYHIIKPKFIQFESKHNHVGANVEALDMLKSIGYHCETDSNNSYCTLL